MPRIVERERRRWNVVTPPPDLDLVLAVLRGGLGLVQALKCPVVPLVQPPVLDHRNPQEVELVERDVQRSDRTLQDRRERVVEGGARAVADPLARLLGVVVVDVGPGVGEVGEEADADAGGQVLLEVGWHGRPAAFGPGGARDIEMGPGNVANEIREEPGGSYRAGGISTDVLEVAQRRLDLFSILRPEWHSP